MAYLATAPDVSFGLVESTAVFLDVNRDLYAMLPPDLTEALAATLAHDGAIEPEDPSKTINVRGRDVQTGSPGAVDISAGEVHSISMPIIKRIADEVRAMLTELAPEVAGDVYTRGVILTGGGALMDGLSEYLQNQLALSVRVADEPRFAIVRGLQQLYEEPLLLRRVARTEPHPLLDVATNEI